MSLRLWPYFVEPLRGRRGAALLSVLAISLGVALGMAVNAVNRAALAEFAEGMRIVSGQADLEVRGPRRGFDEMLYPQLARLSEVAVASPLVELEARVPGRDLRDPPLKVIGLDIFRAGQLQRRFAPEGEQGGAANEGGMGAFGNDSILLSPAAASWLGVSVGDTLKLQSGLHPVALKVTGLLPGVGTSQRLGAMDIAAAQWRFDRLGLLNRVSLRFAPGVDPTEAESRIAALLPPGVVAQRPEEAEGKQADLSRAYRVNLNMLAMIALLTGAFLVLSAQSLAVVRRRSELAFLRAAGATRAMVVGWLVGEGALVGALGGVIGIGLGYGLAHLVLAAVGGDLGAGYFSGLRPALRPDWLTSALFVALGVVAGAAGAFVPALEAASAPPARSLKAGDDARVLARLDGFWPGVLCLAAGGGTAFLPPVDGLPVFGYVSIALLLFGAILLLPRLAARLFGWLPERGGAALQIAQAQLKSAPGAAAVAGAGILASVAVAVAMAIMVSSFRVSLSDWLEQVLPADLYARSGRATESGFLTPAEQETVRNTPGVARAQFQRHQNLLLSPDRPPVALLARTMVGGDPGGQLPMVAGGKPARTDLPAVWVSEAMVDGYGFRLGKEVTLPFAGRAQKFVVAGVWRDFVRQSGAVVLDLEAYRRLSGDALVTEFSVWLAPGFSADEVTRTLRDRLDAGTALDILQPGEIRRISLTAFDRTFAVTYAMEAVAVLIGLAGVAASFGALALARRREFGMLRHIGMTRAQVGAMLAAEGALVSALGVGTGLLLGGGIGFILIRVINRQSFHWSMDVHVPLASLAVFALAMVVLASAVSVLAGRRAMRTEAVRAVREDW